MRNPPVQGRWRGARRLECGRRCIGASGRRYAGRDGSGSMCRRSEEHTSELQSLMRISYAVFCLKKKKNSYGRCIRNYINIMKLAKQIEQTTQQPFGKHMYN